MKEFQETLYDALAQTFRIDKLYFEQKTGHQHLMIFHNAFLGRVMTLDGIVQTTERDEFIYHEMMTHVPVLAHGNVKRVLIIGGGDGAMLRETLRHSSIEQVTMVEIDQAVIDMAKQYLPNHSRGAFDDPRTELVIADGMDFVRSTENRYDVIISDSTDPIGPGEVLFTGGFYEHCHRILNEDGIMVAQNGVPFFQLDEVTTTHQRMSQYFRDQTFYTASVPTYYGGVMAFAWGANNEAHRKMELDTLTRRFKKASIQTRYYTPEIHLAAFALPGYIQDALTS